MGCPFFLSDSWTAGSDAAVVAVLTPCLKDGDGNGIAQVEAAVLRPHRQADALRLGEGVADAFGKAGAFAAEDEPVARRKARVRKRMRAVRRHGVHAGDVGMLGLEKRLPRFVDADRRVLVIVEPRALHVLVVKGETERLHQVKRAARVGAEADDVARVGRNFGMNQNDVEHVGDYSE